MRKLPLLVVPTLALFVVAGCQETPSAPVTPDDVAAEFGHAPPHQGAEKVSLYGPADPGFSCEAGGNPSGDVGGFAVLNVENGTVTANVRMKKVSPNTTYTVWLNQAPGDCPTTATASFTTNRQGNGGVFLSEPLAAGATHFWVSVVEDPQPGDVFRSPAAALID